MSYRRVPKVTTIVTFGFSTLRILISLLSGGRYFRVAKTCTPHGHFEKQNRKNVKGILFEKKVMYVLYFKGYE